MALKTVPHAEETGPMVAVGEGGSGARYAAALCVMYWLLLSYPVTLAIASVATVLITVLIYLKTLLRRRDSVARLTCRDSALSHYVTLHCHAFRRALQLPMWFRNRHVQTLLGLCAREPGVEFHRKYLQLHDKGLLALDWEFGGEHLPHGRPLLLVLPDLPQSAVHLGALCREAFNFGMKAVVLNRRGQGGSPVNTPKLPGYGETQDLREVVEFLREDGITISAVGIGTGGDLLLSYLGQYGSSAHLKSAVCISPSYAAESTLHGLSFPYSCVYLSHLKHTVLRNAKVFGEVTELARGSWSVKEFDRRLHCEGSHDGLHQSLEDFWAENEPLREADEISIPVLCVSSLDDPVCCSRNIQHELFRTLPNFFLLTVPQGGHAGFRHSLQGLSWAENAAVDFVLSMLTFHAHHAYVDSYCANAGTQTEEFLDYQCRAEDDTFELSSYLDDDLCLEDDVVHDRYSMKEDCPDGHCYISDGCLSVSCLTADADLGKQMRTPTEAHG